MSSELVSCGACDAAEPSTNFELRRESRNAEATWVIAQVSNSNLLCTPCARELAGALGDAAWSMYDSSRRESSRSPAVDQCDYCRSHLDRESYVASLVPLRGGVPTLGGRPPALQHRLCIGCWTWCRSILLEGIQGSSRVDRAPVAVPPPMLSPASLFLSAHDGAALAIAAGGSPAPITIGSAAALRRLDLSSLVVFVQASSSGRAAALVESVEPAQRSHIVVVARTDSVKDMVNALRLGAGDFLASPLSPTQIRGVAVWASVPPWPRHASGFTLLRGPISAFGLPCHLLEVSSSAVTDPDLLVWLLRRSVRGYDRVGVDAHGNPAALVFCPDAGVRSVADRLRRIIDGVLNVKVLDRAA